MDINLRAELGRQLRELRAEIVGFTHEDGNVNAAYNILYAAAIVANKHPDQRLECPLDGDALSLTDAIEDGVTTHTVTYAEGIKISKILRAALDALEAGRARVLLPPLKAVHRRSSTR
jgi:hypothetical protein